MEEIGINSTVLQEILAGKKTIETRLGKERFLNFKPGDEISIREDVWENGEIVRSIPGRAKIVVTNAQRFTTFREMFHHLDYKQIIPSANSVDEALQSYKLYYDAVNERKYGTVAISFSLLDSNSNDA